MIHIAISSDNNYKRQCYTLMKSACDCSSDKIHFHLISNNIEVETINKMKDMLKSKENKLTVYSFEKVMNLLKTDGSYNLSSYARLFLPNLLDEKINKILYCDCDAVFLGDPKKIYDYEIGDYLCAGVLDVIDWFYKDAIGMNKENNYINAGLVLFNLDKMRKYNIQSKFLQCIDSYNGSVPHHDQGVINKVCKGKILILPPSCNVLCPYYSFSVREVVELYKINYYTQDEINDAKDAPIFVHFTNDFFNRPWNKNCTHPLKNQYLELFNDIPFDTTLGKQKLIYKARILRSCKKYLPFSLYKGIYRCIQRLKRR